MKITPSLAKMWLRKNTNNRRVDVKAVTRIADDIAGGRWVDNGQSIVFDTDGVLRDGQHRLHAVIEAGIPVQSVVVTGVSKDAMPTIDCGKSRIFADVCMINGEANANMLAAVVKIAWLYANGKVFARIRPTNSEMGVFLDENPDLRYSAAVGQSLSRVGWGSILGGTHWVCNRQNPAQAEVFFEGLRTGSDLGYQSPVLLLRNRLLETKADKHKTMLPGAQIYLTCKAWAYFVEGKPMKCLKLPSDGKLSLPASLNASLIGGAS